MVVQLDISTSRHLELNTLREIPYLRALMYYSLYFEMNNEGKFLKTP